MAEGAGESRRGDGKSPSAFRTISEVASELDVPQHVLRFWETKFAQVRPLKRGGGRRYYRPEDIELLRRIRELLYTEGYTIKGVQKLLREGGVRGVARAAGARIGGGGVPPREQRPGREDKAEARPAPALDPALRRELRALLDELVEIRRLLAGDRKS